MPEPELSAPVDECTWNGRLNRAAVGWSRHPLHRCNLSRNPLRKKSWNYWCVNSETHLLSLTYADLGFIGLAVAWFLDYGTRQNVEKVVVLPLGIGMTFPETVAGGDIVFDRFGLRLEMRERPDGVQLRTAFSRRGAAVAADVFVERPHGHETLNVVIPWSDRLFQFTSKQTALPARGAVRVNGVVHAFGPGNQAFGCLDFGRGVWPYTTLWNWAACAGERDGRRLGITLGGKWTDGTGMTENGLCVDGRLHKIGEDLAFDYDTTDWMRPWRIRAPRTRRLDLTVTPVFEKTNRVNLGIFSSELHVLFGRFTGWILTDDGERIEVRDLPGWTEEHRARW